MTAPCQRCTTPTQVHFHEAGCPFAGAAEERERRIRCLNVGCHIATARNDGYCSDACRDIAARATRLARDEGRTVTETSTVLPTPSASLLGGAGRDRSSIVGSVPASSQGLPL